MLGAVAGAFCAIEGALGAIEGALGAVGVENLRSFSTGDASCAQNSGLRPDTRVGAAGVCGACGACGAVGCAAATAGDVQLGAVVKAKLVGEDQLGAAVAGLCIAEDKAEPCRLDLKDSNAA